MQTPCEKTNREKCRQKLHDLCRHCKFFAAPRLKAQKLMNTSSFLPIKCGKKIVEFFLLLLNEFHIVIDVFLLSVQYSSCNIAEPVAETS